MPPKKMAWKKQPKLRGWGGGLEYKTGQLKEPQIPKEGCRGAFGAPRFRPRQFAHVYKGKVLERHSHTGYKPAHFNVKAPPGWHSEIDVSFSPWTNPGGFNTPESAGPTRDPQSCAIVSSMKPPDRFINAANRTLQRRWPTTHHPLSPRLDYKGSPEADQAAAAVPGVACIPPPPGPDHSGG